MIVEPIKTRALLPPSDDLFDALFCVLPKKIPERSILAVTSKVVSISEGRCVADDGSVSKRELAEREADLYIKPEESPLGRRFNTITKGILIGSAGIDASNGDGYFILWPVDPERSASRIRLWLKKMYGLSDIGVLITDSHTMPLRRGAVGLALASAGFEPLRDYRGTPDIFGRAFKAEQANLADGLAAAAVVAMGEGSECTPAALVSDIPRIVFRNAPSRSGRKFSSLVVPLAEDVFASFLGKAPWQRGRKLLRKKERTLV